MGYPVGTVAPQLLRHRKAHYWAAGQVDLGRERKTKKYMSHETCSVHINVQFVVINPPHSDTLFKHLHSLGVYGCMSSTTIRYAFSL